MQEEAKSEGNLTLVKNKTVVTPVLGRVDVKGDAHVIRDDVEPAANNTRWVFDVETEGGVFVFDLCEFRRGRRLSPDLFSFAVTPTSEEATEARYWCRQEDGSFVLHVKPSKRFSVRVAIDVMHSATR